MSYLDTQTEGKGKLLRRRAGHTTCIDVLRILTVEFIVGIEEEEVGGIKA